jgi:O-antigen/teichoic acid export membrane protein
VSIGKNTAVGLATNAVVFALGIVLSVVLTRSLGVELRGVYALLVITNTLLTNVTNLSVGVPCSTLLARGRYTLAEINTAALSLTAMLGLVAIAGTTLVYPLLQSNVFLGVPYEYLLVALLLVPLTMYQGFWNSMMIGVNRVVTMNKFSLALNLGNTLLMLLLVGALQLGIRGFLVAWLISGVAGLAGALLVLARSQAFAWPPRRRTMRDLLNFGIRVHGMAIAHHIFLRFDTFVVKVLVGTTGLGLYSLSFSLAEKLWAVHDSIVAASLSKIAGMPLQDAGVVTAKVARGTVVIMLILAVPLAIVSPWLIPFLYGEDFAPSVLPFVILLGGVVSFAVMMVVNSYILGQMERPGLLSITAWLQLLVSVPLYVIMISVAGIVGAAIASTVTYFLAMLVTLFIFSRHSGISVWRALVPRASDFADYLRVMGRILRRVPVLRRYAGHSS